MKNFVLFICCLVLIFLSVPALSEENQTTQEFPMNCEEQAIDLEISEEEFDVFVTECEAASNNEIVIMEQTSELHSIED